MEKKQGKIHNTGKTQRKHRELYLGWNVATLNNPKLAALGNLDQSECSDKVLTV